jgi:transcriptional regulator with XRE-family HTH domain
MTIAPTTEPSLDLVARMERLCISQEFLAQYVGLSQSEVSKLISGVRPQGEGHRKINDALKELEGIALYFLPMKPLFDDADAVKKWRDSPRLPNLFSLIGDAQWRQLDEINRLDADNTRMEREIEEISQKSQKLFLEWLNENQTSGRR